ncbi:MAG: HEAT repeat domain-containing protein, partial [Verrucomicrobiota bacterium]|nr:HEAT repeat domain-containing protein [Verrucomicrobiota bacterium]
MKSLILSLFFIGSLLNSFSLESPLSPEQAIASFQLEPGLKAEIVVAEPMVVDPVAVAWDETGKMYVVEDRGYPTGPGKGKPPEGQIVLLEDTKGDGKYDKRTVFADGLTFPNGVMPWKGGVYVTCAPNLYYFKDTDGDGKADVKKIVFKGFQDLSTTQLRVSHPILNIDNWIYLTSGLTAAKVSSPEYPNHPVVFCNRTDFRFKPDTDEFEETSGTAQFGQTFDNFGHKFICSNRNHNQHVVMQSRYLKRNPNLSFTELVQDTPDHGAACKLFPLSHNITTAASHTGFFTSACGVTIYEGTAMPEKYRGNFFTCEPAGNLVHHDVLKPSGDTFVASRAYEDREFIASPDNWFRPVNLAVGPDGALYVCDMYRKTIEHPEYLPEEMRKTTDFTSGKDNGRIYRISAANEGIKKVRTPNLDKASIETLCVYLNDPNSWWSMTAHRLLIEKKNPAAIPILKEFCKNGKSPEARVHALRILESFGALDEKEIKNALADKNENVREQGILLAEPHLAQSPELTKAVLKLADDSNSRVRFQCALSLGETSDSKVIPALAKIATRDATEKWTRAATLSSI